MQFNLFLLWWDGLNVDRIEFDVVFNTTKLNAQVLKTSTKFPGDGNYTTIAGAAWAGGDGDANGVRVDIGEQGFALRARANVGQTPTRDNEWVEFQNVKIFGTDV